jgi:Putative zinc-finger
MTCAMETSVGAYILGTLEPGERDEVARHLETCLRCQTARDEFAALPGLLSRVTSAEVEAATAAPPAETPGELAFRRLAAAASRDRRTRRRRAVLGAAAGLLLVIFAAGAVVAWPSQAPTVSTWQASHGAVRAKVSIQAADTGSRLRLQLNGVPSGERCRLVAVSSNGQREVAGTWTATYAGTAEVSGSAGWAPADVSRVVVETLDGHNLVTIPMSG